MIKLTSLAGKEIFINFELIRHIESTPDTILCFIDGQRMPVKEKAEDVQKQIIEFKKQITTETFR